MEIITLDKTTFLPKDTIRSFDELSWIERFQTNGEFVLTAEDNVQILDQLPVGALISHNDTRQVMIVEDQEITRDESKNVITKITGRSFETFFENRVLTPAVAGVYLPLNHPVSGKEYTFAASRSDIPAMIPVDLLNAFGINPTFMDADFIIPNMEAVLDVEPGGSYPDRVVVERGELYARVMPLIQANGHGLRTDRPLTSGLMYVVVYDGDDVSLDVTFSAFNDDFTDARYFKSINKYKTGAIVAARDQVVVWDRPGTNNYAGLDRRMMYVAEASDFSETGLTAPQITDTITQSGRVAVEETKTLDLTQCTISDTAEPRYKIHYNLGDVVTVIGEFGKVQKMKVVEHILTADKQGVRGQPSLNAF